MEIRVRPFADLSGREMYDLLQLRSEVFVVTQTCIYLDMDGQDARAFHALGSEGNRLVACTRIFPPGVMYDACSIGRVAVSPQVRNKGYGRQIMGASVEFIETHYKTRRIILSAQSYLIAFYREFGFVEHGEEYLEDGIPHIKMVRE